MKKNEKKKLRYYYLKNWEIKKKERKKVRYPLVGTKLGFAYAVANRETSASLFLDIHIPPIPIPIFFLLLFSSNRICTSLSLETLYF